MSRSLSVSDCIVGPNRVFCDSIHLFVCGNIYAIYYEVLLKYGYHGVSRFNMTGVATLPKNNVICWSTKRPRGSYNTSAKPTRRQGVKEGGQRVRKEGGKRD